MFARFTKLLLLFPIFLTIYRCNITILGFSFHSQSESRYKNLGFPSPLGNNCKFIWGKIRKLTVHVACCCFVVSECLVINIQGIFHLSVYSHVMCLWTIKRYNYRHARYCFKSSFCIYKKSSLNIFSLWLFNEWTEVCLSRKMKETARPNMHWI